MKKIYRSLAALACAVFLLPAFDVSALEISKQYISHNRSYQFLAPSGIVIHDTDNAGATSQNNRDYFNRVDVSASAHYFTDWYGIIQCLPENEVGWHAGRTANHKFLSIEICMPKTHDVVKFNIAYQNAVNLAADMCKRYGWGVDKIYSHYWCSYTFKQTDHEDPVAFFKEYGKSMDTFKNDVAAVLKNNNITEKNIADASAYLGSNVTKVQYILNCYGYNLSVDGKCGKRTTQCIGDFQRRLGLHPDLLFGSKTIQKAADNIGIIQKGSTNRNANKLIQYVLKVNPSDGWFGNKTQSAVLQFQKENNIGTDGKVGPKTFRRLLS